MRKSLMLVVRNESHGEFKLIARRVIKKDPDIDVLIFSTGVDPNKIPKHFLEQPLLSIYLCNPPPDHFISQAGQLAVKSLSKLQEYLYLREGKIPSLPIEEFKWNMKLDETIYGDWVVLKPQNKSSTGKDVNMVPSNIISELKLSDFPQDHLIHQDGYYVQKFIKTGQSPFIWRVLVFLDEILLSFRAELNSPYPDMQSDIKKLLNCSVATNFPGNRTLKLEKNQPVNDLAKKVSKVFPELPLLGIDIIQEEKTGELFVLEVNPGGNSWAFSNIPGENFRKNVGIKNMIHQYKAWDRAAEALVRKVNELAK